MKFIISNDKFSHFEKDIEWDEKLRRYVIGGLAREMIIKEIIREIDIASLNRMIHTYD